MRCVKNHKAATQANPTNCSLLLRQTKRIPCCVSCRNVSLSGDTCADGRRDPAEHCSRRQWRHDERRQVHPGELQLPACCLLLQRRAPQEAGHQQHHLWDLLHRDCGSDQFSQGILSFGLFIFSATGWNEAFSASHLKLWTANSTRNWFIVTSVSCTKHTWVCNTAGLLRSVKKKSPHTQNAPILLACVRPYNRLK